MMRFERETRPLLPDAALDRPLRNVGRRHITSPPVSSFGIRPRPVLRP
jgi:hypothetical protein